MLLTLSRELRDLIIEEALLDPEMTISEPPPHTKLVSASVSAGHPLRIKTLHIPLLCTTPQLRAETLQRAKALGNAIPVKLEVLILPSGEIQWTWLSAPLSPVSSWGRIETMKVQVRVQPVRRKCDSHGRISGESFATTILNPMFASLQEMILYILCAGGKIRVNSIGRLEVHVLHANDDFKTNVQKHSAWFVPSDRLYHVERSLRMNMGGFGRDHDRDHNGWIIESIGLFCGQERRSVCMCPERLRVDEMVDRRRAVAEVAYQRRQLGWGLSEFHMAAL
jgi:hypothetical protein